MDIIILLKSGGGTLWAWGLNNYGQLGDGATTNKTSPVQIGTASNWVIVTAGIFHTLGIKSDGTLWAWGLDSDGQLGDGTTDDKTSPVQIGTANNWVSVSAGQNYSLALKSDGTLWAWGFNGSGQLGDGTILYKSSPIQIGTANNWMNITAGNSHSIAMKSDGTLWAWGHNAYGQLGDGTTINKTNPVQVGIANGWLTIAAGFGHSIAIKSDGAIWAWGDNSSGQLGDGTTNSKTSPAQIGTANKWLSISAAGVHSIATQSDGKLWAWGYNYSGELGDGSLINKTSPLQIGAMDNLVSVSAGGYHALALKSERELIYPTGYNADGELGDGSTIDKKIFTCNNDATTPLVLTISSNATICLGATFALTAGGAITYVWSPSTGLNVTTGISVTASPTLTTTYTVTGTDPNTCVNTAFVTVVVNSLPSVSIAFSSNVSCFSGNNGVIMLNSSGGSSPYTYSWFPTGGSSTSASNLVKGSYTISIKDSKGCSNARHASLSEPATALGISVSGIDATCSGCSDGSASVSASGGTSPYRFIWSNGTSAAVITGVKANTYTVCVTDANECNICQSQTIGQSTGISTFCSDQEIKIYPNPSSEYVFVEFTIPLKEKASISLVNLVGEHITEEIVSCGTNSKIKISTTGLPQAVYFIQIKAQGGTIFRKMIQE